MFIVRAILPQIKQFVFRFVIVMGSCLLLAFLLKNIFDIDMHSEFIFAGTIGMIIPSATKKYIPVKQ